MKRVAHVITQSHKQLCSIIIHHLNVLAAFLPFDFRVVQIYNKNKKGLNKLMASHMHGNVVTLLFLTLTFEETLFRMKVILSRIRVRVGTPKRDYEVKSPSKTY